jgi:hypothetical protein
MGYREEKGKVEAAGKTINQEACRPGSQAAQVPSQSPAPCTRPPPLPFPHVLESSSSERKSGEVARERPLSGPSKRLFSQLLVTSVQCEGKQLSQASGMCSRELRNHDNGRGANGHSSRAPHSF